MSNLPRSSERGFTILECEIALLVLSLAVILMMKMIAAHDVLLQDFDGWLEGDEPTYYVLPRANDYQRWLEHAPNLSLTTTPPDSWSPPADPEHIVTILSKTKVLDPPSISILVQLRRL